MIQQIKKILAPIDFSEYSMRAMRAAWELAKDLNAEMHVVHVVEPQLIISSRELARESSMLEQGEEELARIKKAEFADSDKVTTAVMVGPPVTTLADYANQQQISLIVMGTHGRTGGERLLMGSVSEKLARNAPCSVLIYR
ncbi:MAG TPA: universal stress protein [Candidatus Binataceae bacterium]|nr:universal stress protein [Candidatus Binataceae bacterium]